MLEAWSLTFKEEQRLRVLESRVLREIFEPNITTDWEKLQYDELHDAFCSPCSSGHKFKEDEMGWAFSIQRGEKRCILSLSRDI